jgi:hypothetical protein
MITLTYDECKFIHELILFQKLLDHRHRKQLDKIGNKIIIEMEELEKQERIKDEDQEDNKFRKRIVK